MYLFNVSSRSKVIAALFLSCNFLSGCGSGDSATSGSSAQRKEVSQIQSDKGSSKKAGSSSGDEFEGLNKPLRKELKTPSLSGDDDYVDVLTKLNPIRFYNAFRGWDESDEDIARSISGAIMIQHDAPELFAYETELAATDDAFHKRDLVSKVASFVKVEASKVAGNYRVRMVVDAELKSYDFEKHRFISDNCLFSEKLEYTSDEMRNQSAFAKAQKPRCYLQPSTTNYLVGIVSGSKVRLDIADESLARMIESNRANLKYEVYGYVRFVEREKVGGKLTEMRRILIEPQKINLVARGVEQPIYSRIF
ncbi:MULTISPECIES: hypothetical protein [Pseudomonas]|uniref:hypothetical protein n=1 Tax=Pseudomonas TaxID=286 RepID=UPI00114D1CE7|nr:MULTISPECIES: hypothetical protein [Pseudomonas]